MKLEHWKLIQGTHRGVHHPKPRSDKSPTYNTRPRSRVTPRSVTLALPTIGSASHGYRSPLTEAKQCNHQYNASDKIETLEKIDFSLLIGYNSLLEPYVLLSLGISGPYRHHICLPHTKQDFRRHSCGADSSTPAAPAHRPSSSCPCLVQQLVRALSEQLSAEQVVG